MADELEWAKAGDCPVRLFGAEAEAALCPEEPVTGTHVLALGGLGAGGLAIEGSLDQLAVFAERVHTAVTGMRAASAPSEDATAELSGATVHLVQRETFDGLYVFVDAGQAAEYSALYPGADCGAVQILGRSAAVQLLIDSQPCPHCGEMDCDPDCGTVLARCPCGSNIHDLATHPTSANIGFHPVIGECLMDDPIAEHRDGEHDSFPQSDCRGACKREEILEFGNGFGLAGGVGPVVRARGEGGV